MTLFCEVYLYPIFKESNMKGKHLLELNIIHSNVTTFSTDFSLQNLVFKILVEFLATKITLKSICTTF
jgi:hypothetical protein